jgi:tRNA(adenine34) deaminase
VIDDNFMQLALDEADQASALGEVPVGCVIVDAQQRVVGTGHNLRESQQDPLAHAELIAIRKAALALGSWRLSGATLYVTLEPCPMCAGALINARIERLVYGADDPKAGAVRTLYQLCEDPRLNHRVVVLAGVRQTECAEKLRKFFQELRKSY